MIDGVEINPLRRIPDERGAIMYMLRNTDPVFSVFGEIYFSTVYPGVVKGWHVHSSMVLNYAVVHGTIKLVMYDDRPGSPSFGEVQEIFLGDRNYALVTIPPLIWNGFKGIGDGEAIVANCATEPHDPDEITRRDPFDGSIPYDWDLKHR
jgi:dTDP-4-dehydrorhamnose 3,5-epimerase